MTTGKGHFFAVGKAEWHAAIGLGLNPGVAYLVLARATDRSNRCSYAAVNSIEKHTSISRGRAHKSLASLEGARLIKSLAKTRTKGRPTYDLRPISRESAKDMLWLPNTLIDGVDGVPSPVEQIRALQDPMTLRLLIDLYGEHELAEDGGVRRNVVWQIFDREHLSERGTVAIWGFSESTIHVRWNPTTSPHRREPTAKEKAAGRNSGSDFFDRLGVLADLGLAEMIPHVMESERPDAEPILALLWRHRSGKYVDVERRPIEERIWFSAYSAAHKLLSGNEGAETRAEELGLTYRVPLPRRPPGSPPYAMVGILRLTHRPRTTATTRWFANYSATAEKWLARYEQFNAGAPASFSTNESKSA